MISFLSQLIVVFVQALMTCVLILLTICYPVQAIGDTSVSGVLRHHPDFPVSGMVALSGDNLLIWNSRGRAQIRDPARGWSKEFSLPVEKRKDAYNNNDPNISRIIPDNNGMLILETGYGKNDLVLLTNLNGELLDKWLIYPFSFTIISDREGRRVLTVDGIIPLLPKSSLGLLEHFPLNYNHVVSYPELWLFKWQKATILCRDGNLTMADNAAVQCQRLGEGGWQFQEGERLAQLPTCASWLLIWDSKYKNRLTVRSLDTGKIMGKKTFLHTSVMACGEQDGIWVGGQNFKLLSLPDLKTRWRLTMKTRRIENIVILKQYIAYEEVDEKTGNQGDIVLVARPQNLLSTKELPTFLIGYDK